jgi:hypothetical protein
VSTKGIQAADEEEGDTDAIQDDISSDQVVCSFIYIFFHGFELWWPFLLLYCSY